MLTPLPQYLREPPAWFYSRILVGPGAVLMPPFVERYGISAVINCAFDNCSPRWFRDRYPARYREIQAIDSLEERILDWYPLFEATLRRFLRETSGVVYVHCHAGMNRSGFLALTYVCRTFGVDVESLIRIAKQQRSCMLSNPVFMSQVKEFIRDGHLSSAADSGVGRALVGRDAGLVASGDCADPEGHDEQAGESDARA